MYQAAQLSEMLQHFHLRMRGLVQSVKTKRKSEQVLLNLRQWQNLLDLHDRVLGYLRSIGEPRVTRRSRKRSPSGWTQ